MELPPSQREEVENPDDTRIAKAQESLMIIQKYLTDGIIEIGKTGWRSRAAVNYILHTNNLLHLAFKSLGNARDELAKLNRKEGT